MHCENNKIVPGYMVELASSFNATEVWIYCSYLHYYFFGKIARITTKGRAYSNMISIIITLCVRLLLHTKLQRGIKLVINLASCIK